MNEETLWMGDIEHWMDESFIMKSFIEFGFKPQSINIIIDKRIDKNRNFCFVKFSNVQEANNALFKLNGKKIPKTNNYFKLNLTKKSSKNKNIIYVGNLSNNISDNELYDFFKSRYPSVISASIISDDGISRGYGFVHFTDEEEYKNCLKEMNGKYINNDKIEVKKKINIEKINKNFYIPFFPNNKFNYSKYYKLNNIMNENNNYSFISTQDKLNFNVYKRNSFSDNRELLEKNDNITLYKLNKKMQESVNKMFEYYKVNQKMDELPKVIVYYSSNY